MDKLSPNDVSLLRFVAGQQNGTTSVDEIKAFCKTSDAASYRLQSLCKAGFL